MNDDSNIDDRNIGDGNQEIDRWLDGQLAEYAKAEPRTGLEGRVLARLAEAQRESGRKLRWWSALAFSAAALVTLLLVWHGRTQPPHIAEHGVPATSASPQTEEHAARDQRFAGSAHDAPRDDGSRALARVKPERTLERTIRASRNASGASPKLEQFPAPQPLTEQEELLARYVREFPQNAEMMAQLQTNLHQEDEREMAAPWPNASSDKFDEQQ